jgi:hypothetical protein
MKPALTRVTFCAIAIAVSACADRVAGPVVPDIVSSGVLASASGGAEKESGYGVFVGDGTRYLDCIGEYFHAHTEFPFRWSRTVTPSGNVVFKDPFIKGGHGQAEGLTSGTVWTVDHYVGPEVITTNAGEHAFFVAVIHWASETGPSFTIHNTYHFVQNANGDVKVDSFESRCVVQGGK